MNWLASFPLPGRWFRSRSQESLRAKRHNIHTRARLRTRGQPGWILATTRNLSCTGMLVETMGEAIRAGTEVDVHFEPPAKVAGPVRVPVLCQARVVRVETQADGRVRMALEVSGCRILAGVVGEEHKEQKVAVRIVQHEVNNCLTAIVGCAEMLLLPGGEIDPFSRQHVETIREYALRAAARLRMLASDAA